MSTIISLFLLSSSVCADDDDDDDDNDTNDDVDDDDEKRTLPPRLYHSVEPSASISKFTVDVKKTADTIAAC